MSNICYAAHLAPFSSDKSGYTTSGRAPPITMLACIYTQQSAKLSAPLCSFNSHTHLFSLPLSLSHLDVLLSAPKGRCLIQKQAFLAKVQQRGGRTHAAESYKGAPVSPSHVVLLGMLATLYCCAVLFGATGQVSPSTSFTDSFETKNTSLWSFANNTR